MTAIDELLEHYRKLRDQNLADAAEMQSGRWSMGELRDGKRVDITAERIAELKRRAADLDKIIRAYEKRNA